LQAPSPDDYVVATGLSVRLEDFVAAAFAAAGLDWRDHVAFDQALVRPSDIALSVGRPDKAERVLGWRAATRMPDVARLLVAAERDRAAS
ncbi:MAG: GDP-mannose 4,6-dehydratase, partial [Alphaproteobacteria bacterium]